MSNLDLPRVGAALEARIAAVRDRPVILYLLWSHERKEWWRPSGRGYTPAISEAGRYNRFAAMEACAIAADAGLLEKGVTMVAAPEHFAWEQAV